MARPEPPPKGPWSDLPPPPPAPRQPLLKRRPKVAREPLIRNWRGLLIILFLLFVAPLLANWVAHLIMARISGGGF